MAIELLGPPDENGIREPLHKWYTRKIGKPYENTEGAVFINLTSTVSERGLDPAEYVTDLLRQTAKELILDFYGKEQTLALQPSVVATYTPSRAGTSTMVQFSVALVDVQELPDLQVSLGSSGQELIEIKNIKLFLQIIGTAFKVYQQQLRFFEGSISPNINFIDLLDRTKLFFSNLESFATFNQYDLSSYSKVLLAYDNNYKITTVKLLDQNLKQYPLPKGVEYYFSTLKQGSNKYVNEIVSNFSEILDGRKSKLNWTQFLYEYLPDAGIEVNFYGTPRTETVAHQLESESTNESPFGPLASTDEEIKKIRKSMANRENQLKAFKQAQKHLAKEQETLNKRVEKIVNQIQNATGAAEKEITTILNKYNVGTLIEAALECLLFKQGFSGSMPDFIPGLSPFDPTPPKISLKLPTMDFKLPIISINKALQAELKAGIKRAALGAVMALIQAIADIIRELCLGEPSESDTPAPSPRSLVDDFDELYNCYEDFGFEVPHRALGASAVVPNSGDLLESFLSALSPLITARELCDLFSGVASGQVFQVINNLIDQSFPEIRPHFPYGTTSNKARPNGADLANEAIEQFFMCVGNLIDPSYCAGVYDNLCPIIPDIDPCTIEDTQPYQDIIDLLDGIKDIYDPLDPNCGAGLIPALADIDTFNHAVLGLINSVLEPAQQAFVSDLGNFKAIIAQPVPFSDKQQTHVDRLEKLLEFMEANKSDPPGGDEAKSSFFKDLIPTQLTETFDSMKNIQNGLNSLAAEVDIDPAAALRKALANRQIVVAPETRLLYENIEDAFLTSRLFEDGFDPNNLTVVQAIQYYSFMMNILIKGADPLTEFGRTISFIMQGGQGKSDLINIYNSPSGVGPDPTADLTYVDPARYNVDVPLFRNAVLYYAADILDTSLNTVSLQDSFAKKLYPYTYLSLINLAAYRISNSDLFDPDKMTKLNLFPRVCEDGSISNADLLDSNKIKQEAMEEFVNNSCIEGNYDMGPVRDVGLMALVNTYLQVIVVDMLLKNIFMVNEFGVEYLANAPEVVNELLTQATNRVVVQFSGLGDASQEYNFPGIVKVAAAMTVKKEIRKDPEGFRYPISGPPTDAAQLSLLANVSSGMSNLSSNDDPVLQTMSLRHMFEKRLIGTQEKIKTFFNVEGDSVVETFILNGMKHVEMVELNDPSGTSRLVETTTESPAGDFIPTYEESVFSETRPGGLNTSLLEFLLEYNYLEEDVANVRDTLDTHQIEGSTDEALFKSGLARTSRPGGDRSSVQEQIRREWLAYEKYGALVAERYFKVVYDPNALEQFAADLALEARYVSASGALEEIQVALDKLESLPLSIGGMAAMTQVQGKGDSDLTPGSPIGGAREYLLSFKQFKELFSEVRAVAEMMDSGFLPIPLYLAGYQVVDHSGDYRGLTKNPLPVYMHIAAEDEDGTPYRSQDRLHLSDYDLIRSWWKAHKDMPAIQTGDGGSYNVDGIFSRNNRNFPAWDTDLMSAADAGWMEPIGRYPDSGVGDVSGGGSGEMVDDRAAYYPILTMTEMDTAQKHAPGNFLFHIKQFDGATFGPVVLDADAIVGTDFAGDQPDTAYLSAHNHQLLVRSKNFQIIIVRPTKPGDEDEARTSAYDRHETYLMISRAPPHFSGYDYDAHIGGYYSSVDLYGGSGDDDDARTNYDSLTGLFETYETEEALDAYMDGLAAPPPLLSETTLRPADSLSLAESLPPSGQEVATSAAVDALRVAFPSIVMASRLVYLTPAEKTDYWTEKPDRVPLGPFLAGSNDRMETTEKYKSFFLIDSRASRVAHIATNKRASVNLTEDFYDAGKFELYLLKNGATGGFNRFVNALYEENRLDLASGLASSSQDLFGSNQLIDIAKILQYLYITGEIRTYYSLFTEEDIFTDTKQILLLAIQAAMAGSDTTATSDCDVSALDNMLLNGASSAATPMASMGQSFLNKILKETPKYILKGLVELCEPHVIISSSIKKVSKQVFQGMEQAQAMADAATAAANGLSGLDVGATLNRPSACDDELGLATPDTTVPAIPNLPGLEEVLEIIRSKIDEDYPSKFPDSMKPQITKDGIDFEGSLPYTFFVPPLTPFGIIYLLLQLGELGAGQIVTDPDCSED